MGVERQATKINWITSLALVIMAGTFYRIRTVAKRLQKVQVRELMIKAGLLFNVKQSTPTILPRPPESGKTSRPILLVVTLLFLVIGFFSEKMMILLMQEVEQGQAGVQLTMQLVKDLIQLLGNASVQVRHGTISAILQYTPTVESRLMFRQTSLISYLRKYVFQSQLTRISLSTLIHFAGQSDFTPQYFKLVEPLVLKMKEWKDLELELSLLLLLNLSKEEEIIARIIGDEEKKGYLVQVLYTLLQREIKLRWILVGVFVNLSSLQRGRRFLVQQKVYVRFIPFIVEFEQKLREASLKILRNCAFQWQYQPFASEILKGQHMLIIRIIKLIAYLISRQNLLHDLTHANLLLRKLLGQGQLQLWNKRIVSSDSNKALVQIELGIDIILILSNVNFVQKKVQMDVQSFKELLSLLKFTGIKEETKDKLQALQIFGLGV